MRWLNELEWVEGLIWGNIWQTDCIAQVDPASGQVVGWLRAGGLRERAVAAAAADAAAEAANGGAAAAAGRTAPEVFNGIAYDAATGRLWVTGGLGCRASCLLGCAASCSAALHAHAGAPLLPCLLPEHCR